MRRMGQVIGLKLDGLGQYWELHTDIEINWPEVLAANRAANLRNCTIFRLGELLFASFEYHGDDYAADMAKLAANPKVQEYWGHVTPLQTPLAERQTGQHWAPMEEIYHAD